MTAKDATEKPVRFDHSRNSYSIDGPRTALPVIFPEGLPESALDVGCGAGAWLRAMAEAGVVDYVGVDGIEIPSDIILIDQDHFVLRNLSASLDLGRRFGAVFCLEVAEHLVPEDAGTLLDGLVRHSDLVVFSAACPGQPGQHHVNCHWPTYWQGLFNARGYTCDDAVRWRLWNLDAVEPWYRQNIFIARRSPSEAGVEPRLLPVIHPGMIPGIRAVAQQEGWAEQSADISAGMMSPNWYLNNLARALGAKVRRKLAKLFHK